MASPPSPGPPLTPLGPPIEEAICLDLLSAKSALRTHASGSGFAIAVEPSTILRIFYRWAKGGKYNNRFKGNTHESKQQKHTSIMKTGCKFRVITRRSEEDNDWNMEVLNNNHNHGLVLTLAALPHHRTTAMTIEEWSKVKQMNSENLRPSQILTSLQNANPNCMLIP
jgi:hypothetical protein